METFFYVSGILAWLGIAAPALVAFCYGIATSTSRHRFYFAEAKRRRARKPWSLKAWLLFLRHWLITCFTEARFPDSGRTVKITGQNGEWRAIGDWEVWNHNSIEESQPMEGDG